MRFLTRIINLYAVLLLGASTANALPFYLFAANASAANHAADPLFSPTGFNSPGHGSQSVTVSTSTGGANLRYTINGAVPTYSTGTLVSGTTVTLTAPPNSDTVIQAIAFIPGDPTSVSNVTEAEFNFSPG